MYGYIVDWVSGLSRPPNAWKVRSMMKRDSLTPHLLGRGRGRTWDQRKWLSLFRLALLGKLHYLSKR